MPEQPPSGTAKTAKSQRTRDAILKAAQELFAEQGYERATVRDIAAQAAIDPAMVIRYFGSKEGLFTQATTFDLALPDLSTIPREEIGATLIGHFLGIWEGERSNGSLISLLRAAASSDDAAGAVAATRLRLRPELTGCSRCRPRRRSRPALPRRPRR